MFVVLAVSVPIVASAAPGVLAPCGANPVPDYAAADAAPNIAVHDGAGWVAPACAAWTSDGSNLVLGLAGSLGAAASGDAILTRFGQVSSMVGVRYWSVTDGGWRTLITAAYAVEGVEAHKRRSDFTLEEMKSGVPLYFMQQDSRSTTPVVYRLRVLVANADRIVVAIDNVTAVRMFAVDLFSAGDLQSTFYLDRLTPAVWGYYGLWGVRTGFLTSGHTPSTINRGVAMFRHFSGIPTDQEPPLARR